MHKFISFGIIFSLFAIPIGIVAQSFQLNQLVPSVYSCILPDKNGQLFFLPVTSGDTSWIKNDSSFYVPDHMMTEPKGTQKGLFFDFKNKDFYGNLYYGPFPDEPIRFSLPLFSKSTRIIAGIANLDCSPFFDPNTSDTPQNIKLAYRITDQYGRMLYDGTIRVNKREQIIPAITLTEGPFINRVDHQSAYISFTTNQRCSSRVVVDGREFRTVSMLANMQGDKIHVIKIDQLLPETNYQYEVHFGDFVETYSFTTAPMPGSRNSFVFAFTSKTQAGFGGGESEFLGVNQLLLQKASALAAHENAVFFQFSGNLISGYVSEVGEADQQYFNWKKAVEPFGHYIPYYVGLGDHEAVEHVFDDGSKYGLAVDKFPFASSSAEAIFASHFVQPENGPQSEDSSVYDPHLEAGDFPSYKENVYSYTYDNLAVIVLNSTYWYTPSAKAVSMIGGNPSGYIMDNQIKWLSTTIDQLEQDDHIDHVVVTINSPVFPTGNNSNSGMWYSGNNAVRPMVAAKKVSKGIIERRDELLDVLINRSSKTKIILSSDEHGYSRLSIYPELNLYPEGYRGKILHLSRSLTQITCGLSSTIGKKSTDLPWSGSIEKLSSQPGVVFIQVTGKQILLRAINPQTMEEIEEVNVK